MVTANDVQQDECGASRPLRMHVLTLPIDSVELFFFTMLSCKCGGKLDIVTAVPRSNVFHDSAKDDSRQPADSFGLHLLGQ